jgi:hypothetical protein
MTDQNNADSEKSNQLFTFLIAGLTAFAESNWKYPYPSTLVRARGLLYGASIENSKWEFESMSDFIRQVQTPIKSWWPFSSCPDGINPDAPLVDADLQIPIYIEELLLDLDDLSGNQKFNAAELKLVLDNRKIRESLQKTRDNPDLQDAYVSLRKFIIETPWIDMTDGENNIPREAMQLINQVTDYYEKPSINMRRDGKYWLCPRCGGILIWANDKPRCATSGLCDRLTNNFSHPKSIIGDIRTLKLSFRKRVHLPGIPEIELFNELSKIPNLSVTLWPEADRYDLLVEKKGSFKWALDVKDYSSEYSLGLLLCKMSAPRVQGADFFYVIPDHRERMNRGYLHRLKKLLPGNIKIKFVSELLQNAQQS